MRALEPSFATVIYSVWKHKIGVVVSILAGLGLFIAAYLLITPVYEASTLLLVGRDVDGTADNKGPPGETVSSLARIASSDEVIRAAIDYIGMDKLRIGAASQGIGIGGRLRSLVSGSDTSVCDHIMHAFDQVACIIWQRSSKFDGEFWICFAGLERKYPDVLDKMSIRHCAYLFKDQALHFSKRFYFAAQVDSS